MPHTPRILIVDDPEASLRLQVLLNGQDWEFHSVQGLVESLELARRLDYDSALVNEGH